MSPFNLERALAGEPVITVKGVAVNELKTSNISSIYKLQGFLQNDAHWSGWTLDGHWIDASTPSKFDLRMAK